MDNEYDTDNVSCSSNVIHLSIWEKLYDILPGHTKGKTPSENKAGTMSAVLLLCPLLKNVFLTTCYSQWSLVLNEHLLFHLTLMIVLGEYLWKLHVLLHGQYGVIELLSPPIL